MRNIKLQSHTHDRIEYTLHTCWAFVYLFKKNELQYSDQHILLNENVDDL